LGREKGVDEGVVSFRNAGAGLNKFTKFTIAIRIAHVPASGKVDEVEACHAFAVERGKVDEIDGCHAFAGFPDAKAMHGA
jgi:hypothetical protein